MSKTKFKTGDRVKLARADYRQIYGTVLDAAEFTVIVQWDHLKGCEMFYHNDQIAKDDQEQAVQSMAQGAR